MPRKLATNALTKPALFAAVCLFAVGSALANPLHEAAVNNDVLNLRSLSSSKAYEVNSLNDAGQTPLAAAFASCVNYTAGQNSRPCPNTLLAPCPAGLWPGVRPETAATLICAGADVNVNVFGRANPGYTLLHLAGCFGISSIDYLLDASARLDVRYQPAGGHQSFTPLEWAKVCEDKHKQSSTYLNPGGSLRGALDALVAADAKQHNTSKQQAKTSTKDTTNARRYADESYAWALQLRDDDLARAAYAAKFPLHAAVASNNLSEVVRLVEKVKVDVNAVDDKKLTPLQYGLDCDALQRGVAEGFCGQRINQQTAQYLVSKGANVKLDFAVRGQLQQGFTLLHYAATMGSTDLVKLLLSAGADANAVWTHKEGEGQLMEQRGSYTPLTAAAHCIACMVNRGAFPKAASFKALLDAGAKPYIPMTNKPATYAFQVPEHLPQLVSAIQKCNEVGVCSAAEAGTVAKSFEQAEFHWAGRRLPAFDVAQCWHVVWQALNC